MDENEKHTNLQGRSTYLNIKLNMTHKITE